MFGLDPNSLVGQNKDLALSQQENGEWVERALAQETEDGVQDPPLQSSAMYPWSNLISCDNGNDHRLNEVV